MKETRSPQAGCSSEIRRERMYAMLSVKIPVSESIYYVKAPDPEGNGSTQHERLPGDLPGHRNPGSNRSKPYGRPQEYMTKPRPPLGQRIKHKGHHHYRPKESHQSPLTSIQAKRRPYLVYSGLDLRRHHDVLGPTTPVTFCRPPGRGIHAHLGSPRRGGRRMIQFIQRSLTHKYVTFRIHVAEDPPGHLRIVVHIHLGIYHNYELGELHLTRSPNRVHDLARVHGVGFAYRKDSAVVEDTLLRQIHIHNLRQGHLQKW